MIQPFFEETLARAVEVLRDVRRDDDERADAACVLQVILRRMHPTEAEISDIMRALSTALAVPLAARWVLGGLSSQSPPIVEKVAGGVERLLQREFMAGRCSTLQELLLVTLDEPVWAMRIRTEWMAAALAEAVGRLPEAKSTAALLIGGWLIARDEDLGWLVELVEERSVTTGLLPVATRWHLLRAAPSVAGWRALASARGPCPEPDAEHFGTRIKIARESLEQALAEAPDGSCRLTMARWLVALAGDGDP